MVMHMELNGYKGWMLVEGKNVEHYGVEIDQDTNTVSCWIASEKGKRFGLVAQKPHADFSCGAMLFLDGVKVNGWILDRWDLQPVYKSYLPTSEMTARPFVFASLELTDDDNYLEAGSSAERLGEIVVQINRISDVGLHSPPTSPQESPITKIQKVHERSKKAMAHRVNYGSEEVQQSRVHTRSIFEKVVTFVFRYRSFDMLQANGIVPRAPSRSPTLALPRDNSQSMQLPSGYSAQYVGESSTSNKVLGKRKVGGPGSGASAEEDDANDDDLDEEERQERRREAMILKYHQIEMQRIMDSQKERRKARKPGVKYEGYS